MGSSIEPSHGGAKTRFFKPRRDPDLDLLFTDRLARAHTRRAIVRARPQGLGDLHFRDEDKGAKAHPNKPSPTHVLFNHLTRPAFLDPVPLQLCLQHLQSAGPLRDQPPAPLHLTGQALDLQPRRLAQDQENIDETPDIGAVDGRSG